MYSNLPRFANALQFTVHTITHAKPRTEAAKTHTVSKTQPKGKVTQCVRHTFSLDFFAEA